MHGRAREENVKHSTAQRAEHDARCCVTALTQKLADSQNMLAEAQHDRDRFAALLDAERERAASKAKPPAPATVEALTAERVGELHDEAFEPAVAARFHRASMASRKAVLDFARRIEAACRVAPVAEPLTLGRVMELWDEHMRGWTRFTNNEADVVAFANACRSSGGAQPSAPFNRCAVCCKGTPDGTGAWACHADLDVTPVHTGECWRKYNAQKAALVLYQHGKAPVVEPGPAPLPPCPVPANMMARWNDSNRGEFVNVVAWLHDCIAVLDARRGGLGK